MSATEVFTADLAKMNAQLIKLGALVTCEDGFQGFDPSKAPTELLDAYSGLVSFGHANNLI